MSDPSAASQRGLGPAPTRPHAGAPGQPDGMDERDPVHLLPLPPPAGGGTCTCLACGLVFQSRQATWVTNRRQHADDRFHGKFKACRSGA